MFLPPETSSGQSATGHAFKLVLTKWPFSRGMLKTLALVLPVFFPSWRFFKSIEPSPRVEWAAIPAGGAAPLTWREYRPRPIRLRPHQLLWRLFWNPDWNDALFVVSCAERIQAEPTPHSIEMIQRRIAYDLHQKRIEPEGELLQFRLVFVHRLHARLVRDVVFVSDLFPADPPPSCRP